MYLIKRNADGHEFNKAPKDQQPAHKRYKKMICVKCGANGYTAVINGQKMISLNGDFYSGDIKWCPMDKPEPLKRPTLKRKNKSNKLSTLKRRK